MSTTPREQPEWSPCRLCGVVGIRSLLTDLYSAWSDETRLPVEDAPCSAQRCLTAGPPPVAVPGSSHVLIPRRWCQPAATCSPLTHFGVYSRFLIYIQKEVVLKRKTWVDCLSVCMTPVLVFNSIKQAHKCVAFESIFCCRAERAAAISLTECVKASKACN